MRHRSDRLAKGLAGRARYARAVDGHGAILSERNEHRAQPSARRYGFASTRALAKLESQSGNTTGILASAPFRPSQFLAIPFAGSPGDNADLEIALRCVSTGASLPISNMRTNDEWAVAYLHLPGAFCDGPVQIAARTGDSRFLIGVGTPFSISAAAYYAHTSFLPRFAVLAICWAWLTAAICVGGLLTLRTSEHACFLAGGMAVLGIAALGVFFVFHFSPLAGQLFSGALFVGTFAVAGWYTFGRRDSLRALFRSYGPIFLTWLVVAVLCSALLGALDNGGGAWSSNAAFSPLRWSSDNQLPVEFAEHMYVGTPREKIVGATGSRPTGRLSLPASISCCERRS